MPGQLHPGLNRDDCKEAMLAGRAFGNRHPHGFGKV